jgi:arsenite/tail-anchored protein-transporting ATPase
LKTDHPRIIIFSGKGGVGKTTVASATALRCARRGLKTIAISIDVAHSLSDSFQLQLDLHDHNRGEPREVAENLWLQEVDIQEELDRNWGEVSRYLAAIFSSSGVTKVLAEELAVVPGMEDVVSLLYINQYYRQRTYDVIVVDCAPTGESLRFIALPSTLDWYMKKVFHVERSILKVARPWARRLIDIPVPDDSYFAALKDLFLNLEGVDKVLLDRDTTSVRLVTNAERMVVRETQRAFMYFCLYGLVVDTVVVNKLFPESMQDEYFRDWIATQQRSLKEIRTIFEPIPVRTVNILRDEVVGIGRLGEMGDMIYGDLDPSDVLHRETPYEISEEDGVYSLMIKLPFVRKDEVDLFKEEGELVVRIGSFKRHVFLPRALTSLKPAGASLEEDTLTIRFVRTQD